jgi:hypothetical protein
MIHDLLIGKDFERSNCGLSGALSHHLPRRTEQKHEETSVRIADVSAES